MKAPNLADHATMVVVVGWIWLVAIIIGGVACTLDLF